MELSLIIAIVTALAGLVIAYQLVNGAAQIDHLDDFPPVTNDQAAPVSIIIPACNEALTIKPALQSVLQIDYPGLEIIAVNDRSTDNTGDILEEMRDHFPHLQVLHIHELPQGWLGKNHALHMGARQAQGKFLLFTDADVCFEKTVLRRAIGVVQERQLDHLSLLFGVPPPKGLLGMIILEVAMALMFLMKPWKASGPSKQYFMGVGAFNLVRADAYYASGGHEAIAMCPVDDIMLGKLLKQKGYGQECMNGKGHVTVEWYGSVAELIDGMMKNTFAGFDFRLGPVILASVGQLLFGVWPLVALVVVEGPALYLNFLLVISRLIFFGRAAHTVSMQPYHLFWSLITPYLSLFILWKAVFSTRIQGGIFWRGTFYSLKELKKGVF